MVSHISHNEIENFYTAYLQAMLQIELILSISCIIPSGLRWICCTIGNRLCQILFTTLLILTQGNVRSILQRISSKRFLLFQVIVSLLVGLSKTK